MRDPSGFAALARNCERILVSDSGGLGDHIQSLPALWALRQTLPQAQIEVLGGAELFGPLVPWIDRAMFAEPGRGLGQHLRQIQVLRRRRYDAAIVITSSNHAVMHGGLSGARLRLARKPDENKRWGWQPMLLTHVVDIPFHQTPMYRQRMEFLRGAGFEVAPLTALSEVPVRVDAEMRRGQGIAERDDSHYIHLSASATDDRRDLPQVQMLQLWELLHKAFPHHRFAVSASNTKRGLRKLQALLDSLSFAPWKVFAGTLDIPGFASVMQGAALHIGPDSGGLHVARLTGTPSVSWFRPNHHILNWFPDEPGHIAVTAPESRDDGLYGIDSLALVQSATQLLPPA